jgi:hypothetical protein
MDLTQLGPSAAAVIVVVLFLRYMDEDSKRRMHETQKREVREERLAESIGQLDGTVHEIHQFMKNLNGKLEKAITDKVRE